MTHHAIDTPPHVSGSSNGKNMPWRLLIQLLLICVNILCCDCSCVVCPTPVCHNERKENPPSFEQVQDLELNPRRGFPFSGCTWYKLNSRAGVCLPSTLCSSAAYGIRKVVCLLKFGPAVLGMLGRVSVGQRWRKIRRTETEEREAEPRTDADICCGIPEFRPWSVFGTQLSAIWNLAILLLHFSLGSFLFRRPPHSCLYLSVVVFLRHSALSLYHFPTLFLCLSVHTHMDQFFFFS